ncbi:hypothetical protein [Nocardia sp. NPDC051832]|uniref:hypothetical protein n=1 Tax=Nocardia sp. NPDC051832 TaxID=3155673 RepID=UPI00344813E6
MSNTTRFIIVDWRKLARYRHLPAEVAVLNMTADYFVPLEAVQQATHTAAPTLLATAAVCTGWNTLHALKSWISIDVRVGSFRLRVGAHHEHAPAGEHRREAGTGDMPRDRPIRGV